MIELVTLLVEVKDYSYLEVGQDWYSTNKGPTFKVESVPPHAF